MVLPPMRILIWSPYRIPTENNTYYHTYMELLPYSCVDSHMSSEMSFPTKTFTTLVTWMIHTSWVGGHLSY